MNHRDVLQSWQLLNPLCKKSTFTVLQEVHQATLDAYTGPYKTQQALIAT